VNYGEFMKDVEERAGLDRDQAEKAVRATLNTLAERLKGGEPKDLASQLPEELKETVLLTAGRGSGMRIPVPDFIEIVADREGAPPNEARGHIQAVMGTLRDAVTEGEFDDVMAQLDPEYRELVPAA
jgi:uncharacterized protein (DUF2267 family)